MRTENRWRTDLAWTAALTVLALGPILFQRGYSLRGDMVFGPDQPWKVAWLGLDGAVPRAVPMDAIVWMLGQVAPGDVVQKTLLAGSLVAAGLGIGRLLQSLPALARAASIVAYLWNPWVYERLAIGQWACVLGYALLPWVVITACRWRDRQPRGWAGTAALLVLASVCAPSMALIAFVVAGGVLLARPAFRSLTGLAVTASLASLPWALPALLRAGIETPPNQFGAFAAQPESSLGLVGSLLSLGGIWKTSVVPPEREVALVVAFSVLLAIVGLISFAIGHAAIGTVTSRGIGISAFVGFSIAVGTTALPSDLAESLPALGILRDAHRYLAPVALPLAIGLGLLVQRLLAPTSPLRHSLRFVAITATLMPILLLPSLAGGLRGDLSPVQYPSEWFRAAELVRRSEGAVVVLPWSGSYRSFTWNHRRAMLDPAPRLLPADVLIDDRIILRTSRLEGEDPYLTQVGAAAVARDSRALRNLGVRWVLVEKGHGVTDSEVPAGQTVLDTAGLRLVDLGSAAASPRETPPSAWVIAADLLTLLTLVTALVTYRRGRTPKPSTRRVVVVNWRDLDHSQAGGAERYAWEVARALSSTGASVEFLTGRDRAQKRREYRDGIHIVRVGGRVTFIPCALLRIARMRRHWDLVVDADCALPVFSPLVLSHTTAVILVVHHLHHKQFGALPQPFAGLARFAEQKAMPLVYRRATTVAVSESTRSELRSRLDWPGPVEVIHNGTDPVPQVSADTSGERVIILGRMSHHKRVDLAIRALARVVGRRPGLHVDIVGHGPTHAEARRLVDELGLEEFVRFHGKVSELQKHQLLVEARLHLCASETEGWGQVVLEAAGHGVPTLARDVPGLRDSVRDGKTGWLTTDYADDEAMTTALAADLDTALTLLASSVRRAALAEECRTWASLFTWESTHRSVVAIASETLNETAGQKTDPLVGS